MIRKLYNYMKWAFLGMSLRHKILLSYLLFIIIPLTTFSLLTYEKFTKILEKHIVYSAQKNFDQTFSYVTVILEKVSNISDIAVSNEDVQKILLGQNFKGDQYEDNYFTGKTIKFLRSLGDDKSIHNIELYLSNKNPYTELGYFFPDMNEAKRKKWYSTLEKSTSKLLWCPSAYLDSKDFFPGQLQEANILSVIRKVKNPNKLTENVGLLRIDFKDNMLRDILEKAVAVRGSFTFVKNAEGVIVTGSKRIMDSKYNVPVTKTVSSMGFSQITVAGQELFYMIRQFPQTDWYLTTEISSDEMFRETKSIRNEIFILILIIATIAFTFAWYTAYSVTKRINLLVEKMQQVQNGKFDSIIKSSYRDEIGDLTTNYNYMLERISILIEERYKAGLDIKNLELKALQAQINPHFLYNTLDMVNWLAQKNKAADVEQAVNSLAMFYKLSLSNEKDEVTIKDELDHITFYVRLQNMRFQNGLNLVIEVDEEIQEYLILKLTLQPLIENAILHGIMKKLSKEGTIIIEGKMENGVIVLFVQDDGIGITEEKAKKILLSSQEITRNGGYGVKNIIERIKLFYGQEYGLIYRSEYGKGTTVEIRIPAKES